MVDVESVPMDPEDNLDLLVLLDNLVLKETMVLLAHLATLVDLETTDLKDHLVSLAVLETLVSLVNLVVLEPVEPEVFPATLVRTDNQETKVSLETLETLATMDDLEAVVLQDHLGSLVPLVHPDSLERPDKLVAQETTLSIAHAHLELHSRNNPATETVISGPSQFLLLL